MKCPELHINLMFGNTIPMEQGEGLRGQFMKNIYDGSSIECPELHKSHVFYPPIWGTWTQVTKYILLKCMKCPKLYRNLMSDNFHPIRRALSFITKIIFDKIVCKVWNFMKLIIPDSTYLHKGLGVELKSTK